jgi:hypothetical protein
MILFHKIIQILHLTDGDRGPMRLVTASDGRGVGRTAIEDEGLIRVV